MKFCSKCGKEIHDEAVICIHCGCGVEGAPKATNIDNNEYSRLTAFVQESKSIYTLGIISLVLCLGIGLIFQIVNYVKLKKYMTKNKQVHGGYIFPQFNLTNPVDIAEYEAAKKKIKTAGLMTGIGMGISIALIWFAIWFGIVMPAIL